VAHQAGYSDRNVCVVFLISDIKKFHLPDAKPLLSGQSSIWMAHTSSGTCWFWSVWYRW